MASDGQFNDQGEQLDDWLLGNEFGNGNQTPDPSAVQISDDGPTTEIAPIALTIDPLNYMANGTLANANLANPSLGNDGFPDLTDLSPRGVDERSQAEKDKATSGPHAAVPPDLISLAKPEGAGTASLQMDPLANLSLSAVPGASQGLSIDHIANEALGLHSVANQSSLTAPTNSSLLIGNDTGHGLGTPGGLQIPTGNHSLHLQLQLSELATRHIPALPGSYQGHVSATLPKRLSLKRDRDSPNDTVLKRSTELAKQLVPTPTMPPKQAKRRKMTRGAPSKAATQPDIAGGASSGDGTASSSGKGSSSKRPTTGRARHVCI